MLSFGREVWRTIRLLEPTPRIRWAILVGLALIVAVVEAIGAALIYVMLGLVSGDPSEVGLPVIGSLVDRFPDLSLAELQIAAAIAVVVFFLLRAAIIVGQNYVQGRVIHNAGARLATHLVRGYLAMPYLAHTQINSSELVRNAFDSVYNLVGQVVRPAVDVVSEALLVVAMLAFMLIVAPQSAIVAFLLLTPLIWILQAIIQPRLKRLGRKSQEARRGALLSMQQAIGGVREIRLLGQEDAFASEFARERKQMARADYVRQSLSSIPRALIETGLVVVIAVVLVIALVGGATQQQVVATIAVFAYSALRLQPSLRTIVKGLNDVRFGAAIIDNLMEDRERVDEALAGWRRRRAAVDPGRPLEREIDVQGVTFSYRADARPALSDVNLTIRRGEFIGICGPTGGGKSTLIDLIAGLIPPTMGTVCIDGRALDEHPGWWYAQLGVVSQNIFLTDDTIRHNIAFGRPDADIDEALLQRAIERAQLSDVIEQLPAGLDTFVGERGVRLSGGQRQRVAVARALYREPSVIIFDEGTSALDAATEAAVAAAIHEVKEGRTLISVAHRVSTVRDADRLILVDKGRIVDEGSYEELVEKSGLFRRIAGTAVRT